MAVDSMQKRGSALAIGPLPILLPSTDGLTTEAGRAQACGLYRLNDTGGGGGGGSIFLRPGKIQYAG